MIIRRVVTPIAATGAAAALSVTAPTPAAAVRTLGSAASHPDPLGPLLALVALAAWALAGWLLLVAAVAFTTRLPGGAGRVAGRVARRLAPAAVRRAVEVWLGLTVAVGVLGAAPAAAGPPRPPAPPAGTVVLDWPIAAVAPAAAAPTVVVRPGDSLWAIAAAHLPPSAGAARVARTWPRWWAANRGAIGADPDLIHPGLRLRPPAGH